MAATLRVGVLGATGKVGSLVCAAVAAADDLDLVAAVNGSGRGTVAGLAVSTDLQAFVDAEAEVVVDFSRAAVASHAVPWLAERGIHVVVGTSGLDAATAEQIAAASAGGGGNVAVVANFAISAVLLQRFAELAATHFDTVEIIEFHHDGKVDAPSGTAIATAERIAAASSDWAPNPTTDETLAGSRGASSTGGIPIHAVRMRGMNAHQEVIFGAVGQTLTLRQDSFDRSSYVPGVLLAVRKIAGIPGVTVGLDAMV